MKSKSFSLASPGLTGLAVLVLLLTSCTYGVWPGASSGSLFAWLAQPETGQTLPLQNLTLKAHARQAGGGITKVLFMVNDTPLATVPADSGQELITVTSPWNPSAEGSYRIQAIAFNSRGQQAESQVSVICINHDPNATCTAAAAATAPAAIDPTIKVGGAPNPVSIGAACNAADRIVNFEAYVPDTGGATDAVIHAFLVGASGERWEFFVALSPGTTPGSYVGTYDLDAAYDGVLAGADGRIEYVLALVNAAKELFRISTPQTISVHYCGGAKQLQGIVKVLGTPDVVFKGKCTPSTIDFVAETDIDPGLFDHVDLAYSWFNDDGSRMGTADVWTRAEMTRDSAGAYRYHLDVNTGPASFPASGQIRFGAVVVTRDNADVASSEIRTIVIKLCGFQPAPPAQGGVTPNVPPAPPAPPAPTCADYNNVPEKCKDLGCNYWSDGTCSKSPEPAPATCADYNNKPTKCKDLGCNYWSDGTCSNYEEPAPPPSCGSFGTQGDCEKSGCLWDEKQKLCISY